MLTARKKSNFCVSCREPIIGLLLTGIAPIRTRLLPGSRHSFSQLSLSPAYRRNPQSSKASKTTSLLKLHGRRAAHDLPAIASPINPLSITQKTQSHLHRRRLSTSRVQPGFWSSLGIAKDPERQDFDPPLQQESSNSTPRAADEHGRRLENEEDGRKDAYGLDSLETLSQNAEFEGEGLNEALDEDDELSAEFMSSAASRLHPWTRAGKGETFPTSILLPRKEFVEPVEELAKNVQQKKRRETAHAVLGGRGFPHGISAPKSERGALSTPPQLLASNNQMSPSEADIFMTMLMPPIYASVMSTLVETRKRLGRQWLRDLIQKDGGPRVIDIGGGGAGILAWRQLVKAELSLMKEEDPAAHIDVAIGKTTVVAGSDTLRRISNYLLDDTIIIPRSPDYLHVEDKINRSLYDVVIAPHTLWHHSMIGERRDQIGKNWYLTDPRGGVLILIEKGVPKGFEAIAQARHQILKSYIGPTLARQSDEEKQPAESSPGSSTKESGMIIAPCTNHAPCPMYPSLGSTVDWRQFCHFNQRYVAPSYLRDLLESSQRNFENLEYTYLAVRRGIDTRPDQSKSVTDLAFNGFAGSKSTNSTEDSEQMGAVDVELASTFAPSPLSFPRIILPPLKRKGHVTMDICTPGGNLERWTVPKSYGKQAYHDARKSTWGDLWGLGAKTRLERDLKPRLRRLKDSDNNRSSRPKFERWKEAEKAKDEQRVWEDEDGTGVRKLGKKWERKVDKSEKRKQIKRGRYAGLQGPQSLGKKERLAGIVKQEEDDDLEGEDDEADSGHRHKKKR